MRGISHNFRVKAATGSLVRVCLLVLCGFRMGNALADAPSALTEGDRLATADQTRVEAVALRVLDTAELKQARQQVAELFRSNPAAATSSGSATLEEAVNETVFAAVLDAVADDPARPALVWTLNAPHTWHGLQVPGSRYGIDNPDNIYRLAFLDSAAHYEIQGVRAAAGPAQFVFELLDSAPGYSGAGKQLGILKDNDLSVGADGSFVITIDPEPANGRPNHIQTKPGAKAILVRDTLSDWATQIPNALQIRRLDPVAAEPADIHKLALKAAELAPSFASFWLDFRDHALFQKAYHHQVNNLAKIDPRQGGWGYAGGGKFKLADDEALMIKVSKAGARYLGAQLTDPWMISLDYIHHTGSLNDHQAAANADGTYTYVISPRDPGVGNWLDTGRLKEGYFQLRWQQLAIEASIDGAIRDVRLIKLADLTGHSENLTKISPGAREQQSAERANSYSRRLGE